MLEFLARLREWVEDHVSWKVIGMALVIVAVIAFCGGNLYQEWRAEGEGLTLVKEEAVASEESAASASEETPASGEVVVHVAGAVSSPGVYTLPADSRVDDAVRAAGATADADLSQLNLAQKLADGQKITVPVAGATPADGSRCCAATTADSDNGALININTATREELETLPSIGEVRAQAILAYREEHGGFRTTDELMEVSGIGEKIFADISPHITV